jgi:glycyl-tRNA synthetase beta chain
MPELLIEILSEEIPARMQARAADDLKRLVTAGLKDAGLEFTSADAYVTPRRLALVVDGVPEKQPDVSEEKRGPNVNAPEQAVNGFKGSLPDDAVIEERETPKGTFFFATIDKKGESTERVAKNVLNNVLLDFSWPKSMRWSNTVFRWVRPMHGILAILDGEILQFSWGFGTRDIDNPDSGSIRLHWGRSTVGHRFLAPDAITVTDFSDYKKKLMAAKVMLDPADRSAKIESDAKALAEKAGVQLKDDPGLLAEVTGLVEWPVVLMGTIEDQFMKLPDEVLITSMRSHQKYFACLNADGTLANKFIVVANTETDDGGAQIVAGNERVLRARLSDAKFFWDQDRAQTLESRVDALKDRVFHAKLGNLLDKVDRFEKLAVEISQHVDGADPKLVARAARLAKADLSTGMVGEFPDLQGLMGRYYAVNDGEDAAIANAIKEHYSPVGPNDACPTAPVSACVALADKIDSLVGFFAIDEKPTGSKDPFALRRSALGVIRLILENKFRVSLHAILDDAHQPYINNNHPVSDIPASDDLLDFFADRLKVHLKERGVSHDLIDAVISQGSEDDLVRLIKRVDALQEFLATEDGKNLLAGYKRSANILRIEEKKDNHVYDGEISIDDAQEPEERVLIDIIKDVGPQIVEAVKNEKFVDAMKLMSKFREPVDNYFERVTVNDSDRGLREYRLKTLAYVRRAMDQFADFSKIEG